MGIEMKNITFGYRENHNVLDGFSCLFRDTCITGIIGPNGCGKTTSLKIMAGYLKPSQGEILYNGRPADLVSMTEMARIRAVVEQKVHSPFSFPVYDFVMLGRTPYLKPFESEHDSDHEIVFTSLSRTNTLHLKDNKIDALSGGELQRVMIARALAQESEYLMLDEPTSHLDVRQQLELMALLRSLKEKKTIIMVIHDINQAARYCDEVILTRDGKVVEQGQTESVLYPTALQEVFGVMAHTISQPVIGREQFVFSLPREMEQ
ncbi:MAG: ABC transporter ATP-binding protein [Methanospirillaceae archaeon]|nr:ABC transporter ATP-binding protein [Methanospirillaceae archaeon]